MDNFMKKNYVIKGNKFAKILPQISFSEPQSNAHIYVEQILKGNISMNEIIYPQPREVRIFISSTFLDFKVERFLFIKKVIPELQLICRSYGLKLYFCDMRLGITDSAVNEHLVEKLCIKEINSHSKTSIGSIFVLLIGNRYGYKPLPNEIPSHEFEILHKIISENFPKDSDLFTKWFQKDENAEPNVYILLPIKHYIPNYINYEDEVKRRESGHDWWQVEERLRKCLKKTCKIACLNGNLTKERQSELTRSVTESEFWNAILGTDLKIEKHKSGRCLVYDRQLSGIMNDHQSDAAMKYIDYVTRNDEIICESSSQRSLLDFKSSIQNIELRQYKKFIIPWSSVGLNEELESHKAYFDKLISLMVSDIKELIDENVTYLKKYWCRFRREEMNLQSEILHHWMFCFHYCSLFYGRKTEIETILKLVSENYNKPIFVSGSPGCGKSAFMAKLASVLQKYLFADCSSFESNMYFYRWLIGNQNPVIIIRFIDSSYSTRSLQQLLYSVCYQIILAYKIEMRFEKMTSLCGLEFLFNHLLQLVSFKFGQKMPLIILIDGIDRFNFVISKTYGITNKIPSNWIPIQLPSNVHIIVSGTKNDSEFTCFKNFENQVLESRQIISLENFNFDDVLAFFNIFNESHGRKLTNLQNEFIIPILLKNPNALYMKMILEQSRRWTSFSPESEWVVGETVTAAINLIFSRLEEQYGKIIIFYAVSYLTIGLNGLSQVEIEDLLSLKDEVLDQVYKCQDPQIKGILRFPSLLWSRIFSELISYLSEHHIDGQLTFSWCHNDIQRYAFDRYILKNADIFKQLHNDMALYYAINGQFKKSCTLNNQKRKIEIANADRLVIGSNISPKEPRKMHCLSYHLMESSDENNLIKFCVANLNFLISYAKCFSVQDLIFWLNLCENKFPENNIIKIIKNIISFNQMLLESDINQLRNQLLGQLNQLPKCLVPIHEEKSKLPPEDIDILQSLCDECKNNFSNSFTLIPHIACFPSCIGSRKKFKENIQQVLQISDYPRFLILIGHQEPVWIINLIHKSNLTMLCQIIMETKPVSVKIPRLNSNYIFIQDYRHLHLFDINSGQLEDKYDLCIKNKFIFNECLAVDFEARWIAVAALNRIALLEFKITNFEKCSLSCKNIFMVREVDKTIAMHFIESEKHALLLTAHIYNFKSHKTFIIKIWQFEHSNELLSIDLQTLSNDYRDNIYLWSVPPFQNKISSECNRNLQNESILIVLPNGTYHFISNILNHKSFQNLVQSDSSKQNRNKLISLDTDGNIFTVVRTVNQITIVEKIDRKGTISPIIIPEYINSNLIRFASFNESENIFVIGLNSGIIYVICNTRYFTWTGHGESIDYISLSHVSQNKKTIKIISYSNMEGVIKYWIKYLEFALDLSKTVFEEMSSFSLTRFSNTYVILNKSGVEMITGTVDEIGTNRKILPVEPEPENNMVLDIEIAYEDKAVLLFYTDKVKIFNLSNGLLWASLKIFNIIKESRKDNYGKQYWNTLHCLNNLLLLTFKKSTGYFTLNCYELPMLNTVNWSKRFLPPLNFSNPYVELDRIISISNDKQNFLVLLWNNSTCLFNVSEKTQPYCQQRYCFQLTSLNINDVSTTLSLVPCINYEPLKKSVRNNIKKTTNQLIFSYAPLDNFPRNVSTDLLLNRSILVGSQGKILIWNMESGYCRLPVIRNFQSWFKHSETVYKNLELEQDVKSVISQIPIYIDEQKIKKYPITALISTTECSLVVSGCAAGYLVIWKWKEAVSLKSNESDLINNYRFVLSIRHNGEITCITVTQDETLLFSGSKNMEIFLSNIIINQCLHKINIHCCPNSLIIKDHKHELTSNPEMSNIILICKAEHIGQSRMLLFNIYD